MSREEQANRSISKLLNDWRDVRDALIEIEAKLALSPKGTLADRIRQIGQLCFRQQAIINGCPHCGGIEEARHACECDWERREAFGPNGDGTTPGFMLPESPKVTAQLADVEKS